MSVRTTFYRIITVIFTILATGGLRVAAQTSSPVVAAASDLQFALTDIAMAFKQSTGKDVRLSFGSSGNFARQIRQNAPFEMFFSADEMYVEDLAKDGLLRDGGQLYGIGRIVLMVPPGSPLKADGTLEDLKVWLANGRITRLAIANPEHAPYGRRAEEALRYKGLWEAIKGYLVLGENVSQAAQFATSSNAQGGIIAYSLALSPKVAALGSYQLIPEEWHQPLRQRMALTAKAGADAQAFYTYVQTHPARAIFRKYGFFLPGEPTQ